MMSLDHYLPALSNSTADLSNLAITEFVDWYCSEPRLAFNRTVELRDDSGLLDPALTAGIRRVKGVRRIGVRLGNWLTGDQGRSLLLKDLGRAA
jgi:hypothetical protein